MSNEISYRECPFWIAIENLDVLSGHTMIEENDTLHIASKNINGIISFDLNQYLTS